MQVPASFQSTGGHSCCRKVIPWHSCTLSLSARTPSHRRSIEHPKSEPRRSRASNSPSALVLLGNNHGTKGSLPAWEQPRQSISLNWVPTSWLQSSRRKSLTPTPSPFKQASPASVSVLLPPGSSCFGCSLANIPGATHPARASTCSEAASCLVQEKFPKLLTSCNCSKSRAGKDTNLHSW